MSDDETKPRIYLLLMMLRTSGGSLVRAADCSPSELALAKADQRHTVDSDGHEYVWRRPTR